MEEDLWSNAMMAIIGQVTAALQTAKSKMAIFALEEGLSRLTLANLWVQLNNCTLKLIVSMGLAMWLEPLSLSFLLLLPLSEVKINSFPYSESPSRINKHALMSPTSVRAAAIQPLSAVFSVILMDCLTSFSEWNSKFLITFLDNHVFPLTMILSATESLRPSDAPQPLTFWHDQFTSIDTL